MLHFIDNEDKDASLIILLIILNEKKRLNFEFLNLLKLNRKASQIRIYLIVFECLFNTAFQT